MNSENQSTILSSLSASSESRRIQGLTTVLFAMVFCLWIGSVSRAETVTLSCPEVEATVGDKVDVVLNINGARSLAACQFAVVHDPKVLKVAEVSPGRLLENVNGMYEINSDTSGQTRAAGAFMQPISEDGELLKIAYEVIGEVGNSNPIRIEQAQAWQSNETEILIETDAGLVTINGVGGFALFWMVTLFLASALTGGVFVYVRQNRRPAATTPIPPPIQVDQPPTPPLAQNPPKLSIRVQCPACQKKLLAPRNKAGKRARCPGCEQQIVVPHMAPLAAAVPMN